MPFSGANPVPSSACLKCQLRCVLQHLRCVPSTTRRPYTPHRSFSTIYSRQAAYDSDATPQAKSDQGVYYKRYTPNGRIVGKTGRKQRQTSEALATNSLVEKSEIVIFRDVLETPKPKATKSKASQEVDSGMDSLKGLSLTAEEIKAAMAETDRAPDEDDVNASIDALRPQAPVLEVKEFDRLVKELLDSYNLQQLSRYLRRTLASPQSSMTVVRELEYSLNKAKAKKKISFTRTRWQPGRTPLEKRRISNISPPQKTLASPKARAAERIVRSGWEITTKVEEQQIGELEVQMPPWALALFFDLSWWGKPKYETLIQPAMLLRNAQVRPYREDGILRITARRQDAEDIATQLENKVLMMGKQQLSIGHLIHDRSTNVRPRGSLQIFDKEQLELISQRTQSVFIQESGGVIGIYSFKQPDRYNARRLLLSMLDLSSRNVKAVTIKPSQLTNGKLEEYAPNALALVPVFPGRGLHFRDRTKKLVRLTLPERKKVGLIGKVKIVSVPEGPLEDRAEEMSRALEPLTADLEQREPLARVAEARQNSTSHWAGRPFTASKTWWVHLGLRLQEAKPSTSGNLLAVRSTDDGQVDIGSDNSKGSVFLRQVPGYEKLLSYFKPHRRQLSQVVEQPENSSDTPVDLVARKSTIVAHFVPSPFQIHGAKALKRFPRFELTMLRRFGKGRPYGELKIESLRGILEEHVIDVPLPDQAIDIRLSRKVASYANMTAVLGNPHVKEFISALDASVKAGGSLHGNSLVELTLPGWMGEYDPDIRQRQDDSLPEFSWPYLFDRFEQVQSTGFRKNDVAMSSAKSNAALALFNNNFPSNASLQYKEVEAGEIGGGHTDISFKVHQSAPKYGPENYGESPVTKSEEDKDPSMSALLNNALAIAHFVTRACRGEIRTWRGDFGVPRSGVVAFEEKGDEKPADEIAQSDSETAKVVDEIRSAEMSGEVSITDSEPVEAIEDDGIAKTTNAVPSPINEMVKAGETNPIAQTSEEGTSADHKNVKAREKDENVNPNDDIPSSDEEALKASEEGSAAEINNRP